MRQMRHRDNLLAAQLARLQYQLDDSWCRTQGPHRRELDVDLRVLSLLQERPVYHEVEFRGACFHGGLRFGELGEGVLRAFVETNDGGDDARATFQIGDGARDEIEADADALWYSELANR